MGDAAEEAAARYLCGLGYRILARRWKTPFGEIDIVAQDGATIVFVEVKARDSAGYGSALAAVDARKRKRIRALAEDYLQFFAPTAKARFDVLTIDRGAMRLYRGAFH